MQFIDSVNGPIILLAIGTDTLVSREVGFKVYLLFAAVLICDRGR